MASDGFVEAAETQARSLGLDTARVFTPHPIQDRTDDEIRVMADQAIDGLLSSLTGPD